MNTILKLIDNTKSGSILDNVRTTGHIDRLLFPNSGAVINSANHNEGDTIHFKNFGMIPLDDTTYAIKDTSIFLRNGELTKPGIIVTKVPLAQVDGNLHHNDQQWFQVVMTKCEIPVGSIVIAEPKTSYRFNYESKEFFYLNPDNILFYFTDDNPPTPGPGKIFLEKMEPKPFKNTPMNKAYKKTMLIYFKHSRCTLDFGDIQYYVVDKKEIYGKG